MNTASEKFSHRYRRLARCISPLVNNGDLLLKGNKPAYIRITKIYNIPTHSIVNLLRWPQQFRRAALWTVTMKVLTKLHQSHHLGCVGVKTSSRIGTGLEGCTQIYLSVVDQLPEKGPGMQHYRLFKWCLISL